MALDILTLFWVLNLTYTANILFTYILYKIVGFFPGARLWITAQGLMAVAFLAMASRHSLPFWAISLGNATFLEAILCYVHAAWIFRRGPRGFPLALHGIAPVFGAILIALRDAPVNVRSVLVSGFMAVGCVAAFLLLVPGIPRKYRVSAWVAGLPFLAVAAGSLAQVGISILTPSTWSFEELGARHGVVYLLAILTATVSLFGFFLLATLRKQSLLEEQGEELSRVNAELVAADRTKDLFVSMLAHDLRSPISGAARYARKRLMPDDVDLESKKHALHVLVGSLEKSTALLDNVLLWSRSRRGDWKGEKVRMDLAAEARTVLTLFRLSLEEKGLHAVGVFESAVVWSDLDSIQFIMRNLLSNAIKFSKPGGSIEVETGVDGAGRVYFRVIDHGVGIRSELRGRLFSIDSRITTPGTVGETGTGMGLILCAEFASRDGATLDLSSESGAGTKATLRF